MNYKQLIKNILIMKTSKQLSNKIFVSLFILLSVFAFCKISTAASPGKLHLRPPKKKVHVIRKPGEWVYLRIPSPGNNYDELQYDVRVNLSEGETYARCTLFTTQEHDDLITAPYVRFLYTNGIEFAMVELSNATFWSNGGVIRRTIKLPGLPHYYYIACGYGYYNDTMYSHMQGGPQETIIDASTGKILHRGPMKNAKKFVLNIENDKDIIRAGKTYYARIIDNSFMAPTGASKKVDLDCKIYNSGTGRLISDMEDVQDINLRFRFSGNYLLMMKVGRGNDVEWRTMKQITVLPKPEYTGDPDYLGSLIPNDSVGCGYKDDNHQLRDGRTDESLGEEMVTDHLTGSRRTNIWNGIGRAVTHNRGFFGYMLGVNLKLNMPYLLEIKYPEDAPRTFSFLVGNELYSPGIHTAHTMGQPEPRYFTEQIKFPLSKKVETAKFIVWAGVQEIRSGFYVGVADPGSLNAPFSRKPLLVEITLNEFQTMGIPKIKRTFPKEYQRYTWVESEDALPKDNVRFSPLINTVFYGLNSVAPAVLSWNAHGTANNSILFKSEQYRQPVRSLIEGTEYETDKIEDSNKRYNFWSEYLRWSYQLKLNVFPRFEYGGSDDLPEKAHVVKSDGKPPLPYVRPSTGKELSDSADITYPETLEDAKKLICEGVLNIKGKYKDILRQLIVRRRANFLSTSYSENAINLFEKETKTKLKGETLKQKRLDIIARFQSEYRKWYQGKLMSFLEKLHKTYEDLLEAQTGPLIYYHWRRSGMPFEDVYFESLQKWNTKMKQIRNLPFEGFPLPKVNDDILTNAIGKWTTTEDGLFLDSASSNTILCEAPVYGKLASNSAKYLKMFKRDGKLAVKIVPAIHSTTKIYLRQKQRSYFAGETFYHSRQFMMYEPVSLMSVANPTYLSFEQANPVCFPFANYARRFFMNFLSLPDIPMEEIPQSKQANGLIVKMGVLGSKTYVAVINKSFQPVKNAKIFLPVKNANYIRMLVK
ncbi:MAG: hypothetical protein DRI44_07395, partial [Chlamydiae bacterium]